MNRRRVGIVGVVGLVVAAAAVSAGVAITDNPPPSKDKLPAVVDVPDAGGTDLKTHGGDNLPPPPPGFAQSAPETPWPCVGNGSGGPRVELLYVHGAGAGSLATLRPTLEVYARRIEATFAFSAAETGGQRLLRLATDPDCSLVIRDVTVSASALTSFSTMISELDQQGFNRTDRKYHAWVESTAYCGIGTVEQDDRPSTDNRSNRGPSYARSDRGCWGYAEAHEITHNLGGVQNSAPNSTGGYHCRDEHDDMCYPDGAPKGQTFIACADASHETRLDCNHDDYFTTAAGVGSYLDTHWNVARSSWLAAGTPPTSTPPPTVSPPTTVPPAPSTTVGKGDTSTSLTVTPTAARVGQQLTAVAGVKGDCGPTGTVSFYVSGRLLERKALSAGAARLSFHFISAGRATIRATYSGDARCASSSDSVRRVIG